jgi:hypothetical protein
MDGAKNSSNSLIFLTLLVVICSLVILGLNLSYIFTASKNEKYLGFNDVRGMAIVHRNLPYTLNFEQQNLMVEHLNQSLLINKNPPVANPSQLNFSELIIYRFNAADIHLIPIGYEDENLIYTVPEWSGHGFFQDISAGNMKSLIEETYDP